MQTADEVARAFEKIKIGEATRPSGVVSEIMKAEQEFGSRWLIGLDNASMTEHIM